MSLSDRLTDEQLQELLDDYYSRYSPDGYAQDDSAVRLRQVVEQAHREVLDMEAVSALSDDQLVKRLQAVYRAVVSPAMFYKAFTTRVELSRSILQYLAESDDPAPAKVDALLTPDGRFSVVGTGLGKSFWSILLMALDPAHNPNWNNKTENALKVLGIARWGRGDTPGQVYQRISDAELQLVALHPEADLYSVDHFMHYVTVEEGKQKTDAWLNPPGGEDDEHAREVRYWKVAPGREAWNWEECRDGGFIAVGWEELGDLSRLSKSEFEMRRDQLVAKHDDWTSTGVDQVWTFSHIIEEGDRVMANRGTTEVLGIGTVTGPYHFVPGIRHGHRLPVRWDDLTPRQIREGGWRRTLLELDRRKFEEIAGVPPTGEQPNIWWVNQGVTLDAERAGGYLWAPTTSKRGRSIYHWETVNELQEDDIVLHNAHGYLRCVSRVTAPAVMAERPHDIDSEEWDEAGRLVSVDYRELRPPIAIEAFSTSLLRLDIVQGPLDRSGRPKQGYLFRFTPEALRLVEQSQPDTVWPDFVESWLIDIEPCHTPMYTLAECAAETGFEEAVLTRWVRAIERKKQAIVYGPPGTGKTYLAERLAKHLVGGGDGICHIVQFHPAYAYEDFIQGIRPKPGADGQLDYPIVSGRFLDFCRQASGRQDRCVLIIDEINRANLARVFGEMMYLLEYRDRKVPLAAGGSLSIPANVRIIGTMNTADRSIALVDHALRRRFAFLALYPNYDVLRRFHEGTGFDPEPLIGVLRRLNTQIGDRHYEVGITFFLREDLERDIEDIWRMEIEPYLEEYFFDQPDKVDDFRWDRVGEEILR